METVFLFRDFIVICMIYVNNYAKNLREHAQGLVCVLTRNQSASLMRNRLNYRQPIFISREVILIFFFFSRITVFQVHLFSSARAMCKLRLLKAHRDFLDSSNRSRRTIFKQQISRDRSVGFFFCLV